MNWNTNSMSMKLEMTLRKYISLNAEDSSIQTQQINR